MVFKPLLIRETKALLKNPGFILTLILLPLFYTGLGLSINVGIRQSMPQFTGLVGVVDNDNTSFSKWFISVLNNTLNGRIYYVDKEDIYASDYPVIVEIPRGFSSEAFNSTPDLIVYSRVNGFSIASIGAASSAISQGYFTEAYRMALATYRGRVNPGLFNASLNVANRIIYGGREIDYIVANSATTIGFLSSLVVSIMMAFTIGFATQISAMEKSEKAFELLLAQPVRRSSIALAKILASMIASLIMGLVYFASLIILFASSLQVSTAPPTGFVSPQATYQALDILRNTTLYTILTTILGMLLAGGVGTLIGGLVSDERTAGIIVAPLIMIFFGISIVIEFIGITPSIASALVSGAALILIPSLASISILLGATSYIYLSLIVSALEIIALIVAIIKLYNSEIIVTGLQIGLRRRE
ncbi:ABC transporter permease [Thermogladius sp. 4427co]|uniref:ABC transporter permease n=1 Tax=Thermogladius sp. 4427co TaxID=3450718 RepID=UPI003F798501